MDLGRAEYVAACLQRLSEISELLEGDRFEESELAETLSQVVQVIKERRNTHLLNLLAIVVQFREDCPDDEVLYAIMLRAWRRANEVFSARLRRGSGPVGSDLEKSGIEDDLRRLAERGAQDDHVMATYCLDTPQASRRVEATDAKR
jgi:hypothetical protein